jgi:hypothetical protein
MLREFNHTNIALIPKVDNPLLVHHFRPISLTNFNYKIISKILSTKLKPILLCKKKKKEVMGSYGSQVGYGKSF